MINTNKTLEFDTIKEQLISNMLSQAAKDKAQELEPILDERECKARMRETSEAKRVMESLGTPPLAIMKDLSYFLELVDKGAMLIVSQLSEISNFITACRRMKSYLKRAEFMDLSVAYYGKSFYSLEHLQEEIETAIRNDQIDDNASPYMKDIRRKLEQTDQMIKSKLDGILRSKKEWFADGYVTTRAGRFVLPVKKEYKNQVPGSVVEISGSKSTLFIEPTAIGKLQDEAAILRIEEDNEIRRILYTLTALVEENKNEIKVNQECMESLDFMFAKAKLSVQMKAIEVPITTDRNIKICKGRHPLLSGESCVPLDFSLGGETKGIVVTGPNTGGKTVALKTVGLLSFMVQCGLHVPVAEGSTFCMNSNVLCDIGDGQSISENLSTFSAHLTNMIEILKNTTEESLILLDELGSGTDPAEGMGLAVAILEELRKAGCLFVATTHYPEVKVYAEKAIGLINARMEFDKESLRPLYQLRIGEAGESCALYIAKRLGLPEHMLRIAEHEAYGGNKNNFERETEKNEKKSEVNPSLSVHRIKKEIAPKEENQSAKRFSVGDSVMVYPKKEIGIVYQTADENGVLIVQVKGKKQNVNQKRLKLIASAAEMYPEDYDFSIVFDTIENRKARHIMERKYQKNNVIQYEKEDIEIKK